MQVDYLVIGQGICGTMLSWFLQKEGRSFVVVDNGSEHAATRIAAGVINPVTGRRYALSWKVDELIPFALQAYGEMGAELDSRFIFEKNIIDFFPSPQMRLAFMERMEEISYLQSFPDQNHFNHQLNYDLGCGAIRPAFTVHLSLLLDLWKKRLVETGCLIPAQANLNHIQVKGDLVHYGEIRAGRVIFCEGNNATSNPWFNLLPFASNKGEALVIECTGLNPDHIYKKGMLLVPLPSPDTFWVGASYEWDYADENPSGAFYRKTTEALDSWLKIPYKVVSHLAAVRPATIERRPFAGVHPQVPQVAIVNGMGSKGTSLAPFFAHELVQYMEHGIPMTPEVDIARFTRILTRR